MSLAGPERALAALACLAGLCGVAASAAAAHGADLDTLRTAAQFLLFHAPAVLALGGLSGAGLVRPGLARLSGGLLIAGLALFSGDLACRALAGRALFPLAAPTGGFALMVGWLAGIVVALVPARRARPSPAQPNSTWRKATAGPASSENAPAVSGPP